MFTRTLIGLTGLCLLTAPCFADDATDYQVKLKAGREAAYKKYLLEPTITPADRLLATAKPTGAATAVLPVQVVRGEAARSEDLSSRVLMPAPSRPLFGGYETPYAWGDLRYSFYDNLNLTRQQRWPDHAGATFLYQPTWDWRYRRSWPRPVVTREFVSSHWLLDGQRYTYVPGHTEYRTDWVVQGWPRYRWNGSHYSVSVSFNR